jgi:predicted oxidoreductase
MSNLDSTQTDTLEEVLQVLSACEQYFRYRDKTNAQIHMASTKYSPITKQVTNACRRLEELLLINNPNAVVDGSDIVAPFNDVTSEG